VIIMISSGSSMLLSIVASIFAQYILRIVVLS
jgi:hypothetical protein